MIFAATSRYGSASGVAGAGSVDSGRPAATGAAGGGWVLAGSTGSGAAVPQAATRARRRAGRGTNGRIGRMLAHPPGRVNRPSPGRRSWVGRRMARPGQGRAALTLRSMTPRSPSNVSRIAQALSLNDSSVSTRSRP